MSSSGNYKFPEGNEIVFYLPKLLFFYRMDFRELY